MLSALNTGEHWAQLLTRKFPYIHIGIGLVGNLLFVAGSVLFHPSLGGNSVVAGYLFIAGSTLMFVGAEGRGMKTMFERREDQRREQTSQ